MDLTNTTEDIYRTFSWHCPGCQYELVQHSENLYCQKCNHHYESVGGIPDLRLAGSSWIDFDADRQRAKNLWEQSRDMSLEELVRSVFAAQPGRDAQSINLRTRQLMDTPTQKQKDFQGWLKPYLSEQGFFLEVGCGGGGLLAGASDLGCKSIGIDVSMVWLVVAQRMVKEWGGEPILAAAMAESLPLPDSSVSSVISFDVIEHVNDPAIYLREINRVVCNQGKVLLTTPNRFSLSAEPHVFIWGVGWLPRKFQQSYVKWRNGMDYLSTRLLSSLELHKLIFFNTEFDFEINPGVIPDSEITQFKPVKKRLAIIYNRMQKMPFIRMIFLIIGPYFYVDATKARAV